MTEDNKYNLYVIKNSVKDIEFLEKADKAVLISGIALYIIPFIFIDLEKIQLINFYNKDFMLGLNSCKIKYDTGCWFYETLLKNKHKIDTFSLQNDYFIHAEGLSWDKNKNKHYITKYIQYWK